jgi:hypothetical protein
VNRPRRMLLGAALVALGLTAATAADAQAPTPLTLTLHSADGKVGATITGPVGAVVQLTELAGTQETALPAVTLTSGTAQVDSLAAWSCDAGLRRFVAHSGEDTARAVVRTPSCKRRLVVGDAPDSVQPGGDVSVKLTDSWHIGEKAKVCLQVAGAKDQCRTVTVPAAASGTTVKYTLTAAGANTIAVTGEGGLTSHRTVTVRPPDHIRLLATGDSMIQIIDSYLKARLPHATVISDAHISTGISKPFMLDWVDLARKQAAQDRPDATVMFIGANDGFPIGSAQCCGKAWIDGYAKRMETMMRSYLRGGDGRVYWLLLPPTSRSNFQRVFDAVNAAARQAQKTMGPGVTLLDDGTLVAPGGRFQHAITVNGRSVVVRQDDDIHLSTQGASLVANMIIQALRHDGLVA